MSDFFGGRYRELACGARDKIAEVLPGKVTVKPGIARTIFAWHVTVHGHVHNVSVECDSLAIGGPYHWPDEWANMLRIELAKELLPSSTPPE